MSASTFIRWPMLALGLVAGLFPAAGEAVSVHASSVTHFDADEFEGSQYRGALADAYASRDDSVAKWRELAPVLAFCDTKVDTAERTWVAVSTLSEREELLASRPDADRVAFIDIACPRAYTLAAYFAADENDAEKAVRWLERAQQLAPFSAAPVNERAFLFNAAGDRDRALASYRHALALSERYASSADEKAMALRGIGWTLVEVGDYPAAKTAFERSLEVDPGNGIAIAELRYIAKLQASGAPAPATPAFSPATTVRIPATKSTKPGVTPAAVADPQRVVGLTRLLEREPFHPKSKEMSAWLIGWIAESPDIVIRVCDVLGMEADAPNESLLQVQSMFGMAAFLIAHPEEKDDLGAQQLAGVESTLDAYASILSERPDDRVPELDGLVAARRAGDLSEAVAARYAQRCDGP